MLQLGLLRVITWPGSRFKKQRIKAQILFVPTRSSWCSPNLNSVDHTLDLVWVFTLIFRWWFRCWQFILNRQSFLFCWGFVRPLSWFLLSLSFFAWTVSFLELQSAGCPSFISPLCRFRLFGLFIYEFWWWLPVLLIVLNHHGLRSFCKDLFGAIRYALGSTERTTLPQVMIKGFKFRKEKLLLLWLRGVDEGLSSL